MTAARAQLECDPPPADSRCRAAEIDAWNGPYGVLVVPLLLDRGRATPVDRVLVVDCPEDEQVRRVMARSGLAEAEVRAIMATQLSRADRLARADDVVDNSGTKAAIAPQVAALDRRYRELAAARAGDRNAAR